MKEQLNFNDIIDLLATKKQIDKKEAKCFLQTFFDILRKELPAKQIVTLDALGTFSLKKILKKETVQENSTNEDKNPTCFEFQFLPSDTLKNLVNKPFSHFEATPLHDNMVLGDIIEKTLSDDNDCTNNFDNTFYFFEQPEEYKTGSEQNQLLFEDTQETIEITQTLQTTNISEEKEANNKEKTQKNNTIKSDLAPPFIHPKRKNPGVLITGLSAILLLSAGVFVYLQWTQRHKKKMPISHYTVVETKAQKRFPKNKKKPLAIPPDEKVTLKRGQTLRLLALEKFGHRDFWVYIYFENKARIKNPNRLPLNFELIVPNATKYGIDANDTASVAKARQLSDEILRNYFEF